MRVLLIVFLFVGFGQSVQGASSTELTIELNKVWGVCKYYANTSVDMDAQFFEQFDKIETQSNKSEFNQIVKVFLQSAGTKDCITSDSVFGKSAIQKFWNVTDTSQLSVRVNFDWIGSSVLLSSENKKGLVSLLQSFEAKRPSTIMVHKKYVLDHSKEKVYSLEYKRSVSILTFFRLYNVIEYYYPYKHLLDVPWEKAMSKSAIKFMAVQNMEEYKYAVKYFLSFIQDTHVSAQKSKEATLPKKKYTEMWSEYPVEIKYAENELFISKVFSSEVSEKYNLHSGDIIKKVNGLSQDSLRNLSNRQHNCSHEVELNECVCYDIYQLEPLKLEVEHSGKTEIIELDKMEMTYSDFDNFVTRKRLLGDTVSLHEKVGYIYMPNVGYTFISRCFKAYEKRDVLILDCRGYGTTAMMKLPKLLSKEPLPVAKFYYPDKKFPGIFNESKAPLDYYSSNTFDALLKGMLKYQSKVFPTFNTPYDGHLVVLLDEQAMSFGESVIMTIKAYAPNAIFIGRPTQGANGNVTELMLPTGHKITYTGIDFRFPDDSELQRKGIQPDVMVLDTKESIINGEDIILKRALEYIYSNYGIRVVRQHAL
jgi:C-terminal processing protease CtpA/Prc